MLHIITLFISLLIASILSCGSSHEFTTIGKGSERPSPSKPASSVTDKKKPSSSGISDSSSNSEKVNSNSESGLKAGYADDNKQFNLFLNFLERFRSEANHIDIDIREKIRFVVTDKTGRSVPNASVKIFHKGKLILTGTTYSDGTYLFYPSLFKDNYSYNVEVSKSNTKKETTIDRQGSRNQTIVLDIDQSKNNSPELDVVFIMDTTGSMGEEIKRLKNTIEIINLNLSGGSENNVQFGMVLYKDRGEIYITKVIPLTNDLEKFKIELNQVQAAGGGDFPEDLQSALKDTMKEIKWRNNSIKLGFIITDAPPHLDYDQEYNYISAMKEAVEKGIKLYSVGTGGLDINGEYVLRQISQYTYSKYIFLTYGEKGESSGGASGSVSHHTGNNFPTDKLESIVIRFAKEEIQNAKGKPLEKGEDYFTASKIETENREDTLGKLFDMAIRQLIDYSTFSIKDGTTVGFLPITAETNVSPKNIEYFAEQGLLSFSRNKTFKIVERKDIQKIYSEWKLNQAVIDEKNAVKVGELLGAKLLVNSRLFKKEKNYEMYIKLINTETGEVQSATKLVIDMKLGL